MRLLLDYYRARGEPGREGELVYAFDGRPVGGNHLCVVFLLYGLDDDYCRLWRHAHQYASGIGVLYVAHDGGCDLFLDDFWVSSEYSRIDGLDRCRCQSEIDVPQQAASIVQAPAGPVPRSEKNYSLQL